MGEKKIKISKYTANYRFKTQARYLQEIKNILVSPYLVKNPSMLKWKMKSKIDKSKKLGPKFSSITY